METCHLDSFTECGGGENGFKMERNLFEFRHRFAVRLFLVLSISEYRVSVTSDVSGGINGAAKQFT